MKQLINYVISDFKRDLISVHIQLIQLKVVCNENGGKVTNVRNRSQTVAIEICLPFNFAVVFDFVYFRFRHSKTKSIGDVLINGKTLKIACCRKIVSGLSNLAQNQLLLIP